MEGMTVRGRVGMWDGGFGGRGEGVRGRGARENGKTAARNTRGRWGIDGEENGERGERERDGKGENKVQRKKWKRGDEEDMGKEKIALGRRDEELMNGKITLEMGSGKPGTDAEGGNKMGTKQWERRGRGRDGERRR